MTALAADYPLTIEKGATYSRSLVWHAPDSGLVDLSAATATFAIYSSRASAGSGGAALLSLTGGSGLTLGGSNGTVLIEMTAAQTAGLTFLTAYYQLKVTIGATVTRLMAGSVTLSGGA